jgi:hypothetical protein
VGVHVIVGWLAKVAKLASAMFVVLARVDSTPYSTESRMDMPQSGNEVP